MWPIYVVCEAKGKPAFVTTGKLLPENKFLEWAVKSIDLQQQAKQHPSYVS